MPQRHRALEAARAAVPAAVFLVLLAAASAKLRGEPAEVLDASAPGAATGTLGRWNFAGTDLTFKAALGEIWVLDAHSDVVPFVQIFSASDLSAPPRRLPLSLPESVQGATALGLAEMPHGSLEGNNLVLLDRTFGTGSPAEAFFVLLDDAGKPLDGTSPTPVAGVPPNARLSSFAINPELDEIAAYDLEDDQVYLLDFTFNASSSPFEILGVRSAFTGDWTLGGQQRGSGNGIAYNGPENLLIPTGFTNHYETRFVLEYRIGAELTYTGRALDLGGIRGGDSEPAVIFHSTGSGRMGDRDVLAAVNLGDDALYIFDLSTAPEPAPADLTVCQIDPATGGYHLEWTLGPDVEADSLRVMENGVDVAVLPPGDTSFTSPLPLLGKAFVSIAVEKDGVVSDLRLVCELENADLPPLDGVQFVASRFTNVIDSGSTLLGVAVTKQPAAVEDFRGYILDSRSNRLSVFDYLLNGVGSIELDPPVVEQPNNLVPAGVALVRLEGATHVAILDPDGPDGLGVPSAGFYSLESDPPGKLTLSVDTVDLSALPSRPFLLDWDADTEGHFTAGGLADGQPVLVGIDFDGARLTATTQVPLPHRDLTPFADRPVTGIAVATLPSGNLLVAGSDTFSRTYTEALLVTPVTHDAAASARIVGYAQGLIVGGQLALPGLPMPAGSGIGPSIVYGLAVAHFAEPGGAGTGVSYLSTPDVTLVSGPSGTSLSIPGQLLFNSTNLCSHPDLEADQLVDAVLEIAPSASDGTGELRTPFFTSVASTDFFYYVINESMETEASLEVSVRLGGTELGDAHASIAVPAGRYYRRQLAQRAEDTIEIILTNRGSKTVSVKVLAGAMGIDTGTPPPPSFLRGDCNSDTRVQLTDAIFGLNWLFLGGEETSCADACDTDDSGNVNLSDMVLLLNHLFRGGDPPAAPGIDACGPDPTASDDLAPCVTACP